MTILDLKEHWLRTAAAAGIALAVGFGAPAWAQDEEAPPEAPAAEEEEAAEVVEEAEEEAAKEDKIVVTGSRLGRDEFSSPAPVQIISGEVSRETGLVDTAALLQESTVATGTQIDRTFSAFVLDNGPGGTPIDLRGLDPNRTLVMINGRRLAPAGIEGAPVAPDLSLVPSALVERFEILLDGASSVYGSDAVAGVVNVILKKDMEGFNLEWFQTQPQDGNGEETVVSATWGATSDRSFIGFGAEYSRRDNIQLRDRDFSSQCQKHAEITTDGEIRTDDVLTASQFPGMAVQPCYLFIANRIFVNGFGSIYWTPDETNIGIPGFSDSGLFGFAFNDLGQRIQDSSRGLPGFGGTVPIDFSDPLYNLNGQDRDADLVQPQENFLFYSFGEHEFDWLGHTMTAYFEASYANRRGVSDFGPAQLFPDVPATNPFNPCGVNGVDCGAAYNAAAAEPLSALVFDIFGVLIPGNVALDIFGLTQPEGPAAVTPIVRIRGDRNQTEFELSQVRMVGGFRGDMAFMDDWGLNNWTYDIHGSYTRSVGSTLRRGILEDRLMLSLLTTQEDPDNPGEYICGIDVDGDGVPDPEGQVGPLFATAAPNCVPVNLFAPSIYLPGGGDFATQEERDFVFGRRGFNTVVEQTVLQGIVKGDAFDVPAGTVSALVGFEYREDKIDSEPDDNAEDGNFILFFNDGGADGSRDLYEAFAEVRIPVLAGLSFAEEFTIEASGRWTEEQFFGSGITYSVKGFYRPTNFLTLRGTYGTSFRAPNLREQFLNAQTGFLFVSDPCEVPDAANDGGVYIPELDNREQQTIDNCILAGVDPFSLGLFGGGPSAEISNEGNTDLEEETSTSFTAGIVFDQPFFESFNLTLGASYWNIDVNNSIQEPSPNFVLTECFVAQPNLSSPFCDRIGRSDAGFVNFVDTRFINVSQDKASGIDFDVVFRKDIRMFDEMLSLAADVDATYTLEREIAITGAGGIFTNDLDGEPNFPIWRGIGRLMLDFKDFRFVWQTRYISGTENDNPDAFGAADTCLGEAAGDVDCTDINFIEDYWEHDMSLAYTRDTWTVRFGIRNVLDTDPPFVDPTEILTINGATNTPAGGGFDLFGRTYFINIAKKW